MDAAGRIVLESMEVVRYPIGGEVVELRQRMVLDPNTGEAAGESIAVTTHPDGTRTYVYNVGRSDPEYNRGRNIRGEIRTKVKEEQADRIVLNLDDTSVTPAEMKETLASKPIAGLQEVITIKDGKIQHIFP